jgi:hypothetical protein
MSESKADESDAKLGGVAGGKTRGIKQQMEEIAYKMVQEGFALGYKIRGRSIQLKIVVDAPAPKAFPATQNKYIYFPISEKGLRELKEEYENNKAWWQAWKELAEEAARGEQE